MAKPSITEPAVTAPAADQWCWQPPSQADIFRILHDAEVIAIVGASNKPSRASYFVATYLLSATDYRVYFINPLLAEAGEQILGQPVYASLAQLPEPPDVVEVFRKAADAPAIVAEAAAAGATTVWLQLGVHSLQAAQDAEAAGLQIVMNRCVKIEHARLAGGLNTAGFNTGVITARRPRR